MFIAILFIIFIIFILLLLLCQRGKPHSITGGEYRRFPKFCCDDDPIPLTTEEYKCLIGTKELDADTKFLYKVMHDKDIRVIIEFDKSDFKGKSLYKKKFKNISKNHGRKIYYQIAVMNDYPLTEYSTKNKYDIDVYFVTEDTKKTDMYTKNYYNTVVAAKLFLNKNSMDFLKYQDLDRFNSYDMKDSRIMFNTYLNFLNNNISLYDQEKIVGVHGVLAYALGLRKMKDIDLFVNNDEILEDKLHDYDRFNISSNSNIDDISKVINMRVETLIDSSDIKKLFTDNKNYMYFLGMKCISLDHNMQLRYLRQRPKAAGEIIAFNIKNPEKKYSVPSVPKYKYLLPDSLDTKTVYDMQNEYNIVHKALKIDIKPENVDSHKFLSTLLFYFKTVYNIHKFKDVNELKNYLSGTTS